MIYKINCEIVEILLFVFYHMFHWNQLFLSYFKIYQIWLSFFEWALSRIWISYIFVCSPLACSWLWLLLFLILLPISNISLSLIHNRFGRVRELTENLLWLIRIFYKVVRELFEHCWSKYLSVWSLFLLPNSYNIILFVAIYNFVIIPWSPIFR